MTVLRQKQIISLFVMAVMCIIMSASAWAAPQGELTAQAAILVNAKTGEVLYEKNADKQIYPASTTKMMTAILAIEKSKPV